MSDLERELLVTMAKLVKESVGCAEKLIAFGYHPRVSETTLTAYIRDEFADLIKRFEKMNG